MRVNGPIQLYPLLRVAVVFVAGIIVGERLADVVSLRHWLYGFLVSVAVLLLPRLRALAQSAFLWVAAFLLGALLFSIHNERLNPELTDEAVLYEGVVLSEPQPTGKVVRFDMMVLNGRLVSQKVKVSLLRDTVAHRYRQLHLGDGLRAFSVMEFPRTIYQNSNFDYPRWLRAHGFVATTFIYYSDWEKCVLSLDAMPRLERLKLKASRLRERLLTRVHANISDEEAYALVAAMTLGDKSALSRDMKDAYAVSGASHVLALSGLHLGIISMLLLLLFRRLRWRIWGQLIVVLAIWIFVFLVGMPISLMRAAAMLTVYTVVSMLSRDAVSLNVLALAALCILIVNPISLWDVGFQLSFMSVLAITLFFRPIYQCVDVGWIENHRIVKMVWALTVVSLAAQIGVAPLVAYYFGRFSCYFLLANLIAVPCAYGIVGCTLLMLLTFPFSVLQMWIGKVLTFIATAQSRGLAWIASLPAASIENLHPTAVQVFLIYLLIAVLAVLAVYLRKMYRIRRQFK